MAACLAGADQSVASSANYCLITKLISSWFVFWYSKEMFKTATKVLQMGSGLALFPRLEYALARSQIELIPVISALCLTCAGFSCKSCRSETCACAFAAPHSFSTFCSLIQPADTPTFSKLFAFLCLCWGAGQAIENVHWSSRFILISTLLTFFGSGHVHLVQITLFMERMCRRYSSGGTERGYVQSLSHGFWQVGCWWGKRRWQRHGQGTGSMWFFFFFSIFQVCVQRELRKSCSLSCWG